MEPSQPVLARERGRMLIKRGLLSRTSPQPAAWPRGFARVFVIELARGATDKSQRKRLTVESATPTASSLPPLRLCVGWPATNRTIRMFWRHHVNAAGNAQSQSRMVGVETLMRHAAGTRRI